MVVGWAADRVPALQAQRQTMDNAGIMENRAKAYIVTATFPESGLHLLANGKMRVDKNITSLA
jgi:hypothetical protein